MGLFSGLFSKKENNQEQKPQEPKQERIFFDDEYCRFYYLNNPNSDEFGYEGEIVPQDADSDLYTVGVYLDTDSPDTTEATKCYAMFKETMADMDRFDFEMKKLIADYCLFNPELTDGKSTQQQLIDSMFFYWMGFFRNGNIEVSIDSRGEHGFYASSVHLTLKSDGSKEIQIEGYYGETRTDKL